VNVARAFVRQLRSDDDATVTREIRSGIRALGIQFPAPRRAASADGSRANPILPTSSLAHGDIHSVSRPQMLDKFPRTHTANWNACSAKWPI
jgi:hypothetical protein